MANYEQLKLDNQLCFPLYVCSKEVVRRYKPLLDELDLTYTQYITMMVIWEEKSINVKDLGKRLFLDSGTLTPLLKALEKDGYITRTRSKEDERVLVVEVTKEGMQLKNKCSAIPAEVGKCVKLSADDAKELYRILYILLQK